MQISVSRADFLERDLPEADIKKVTESNKTLSNGDLANKLKE
ncbi:hypothetical protein SAMN03159341_11051 [Paenibacillus sp. 1_12]|nr:hypothetical protein SAMN03159341_11051 [Paenibacillus sp. 1_12]